METRALRERDDRTSLHSGDPDLDRFFVKDADRTSSVTTSAPRPSRSMASASSATPPWRRARSKPLAMFLPLALITAVIKREGRDGV
jgi:hypothetical protein